MLERARLQNESDHSRLMKQFEREGSIEKIKKEQVNLIKFYF